MDTLLFYSAIVLDIDLVKIQVTGCWYKQAHVRVAMLSTVCIPASFLGGGVQKVFYCLCFGIKKHHFNYKVFIH